MCCLADADQSGSPSAFSPSNLPRIGSALVRVVGAFGFLTREPVGEKIGGLVRVERRRARPDRRRLPARPLSFRRWPPRPSVRRAAGVAGPAAARLLAARRAAAKFRAGGATGSGGGGAGAAATTGAGAGFGSSAVCESSAHATASTTAPPIAIIVGVRMPRLSAPSPLEKLADPVGGTPPVSRAYHGIVSPFCERNRPPSLGLR